MYLDTKGFTKPERDKLIQLTKGHPLAWTYKEYEHSLSSLVDDANKPGNYLVCRYIHPLFTLEFTKDYYLKSFYRTKKRKNCYIGSVIVQNQRIIECIAISLEQCVLILMQKTALLNQSIISSIDMKSLENVTVTSLKC